MTWLAALAEIDRLRNENQRLTWELATRQGEIERLRGLLMAANARM